MDSLDYSKDLNTNRCILQSSKEPLQNRFKSLFWLRNVICKESIEAIAKVLLEDESALLKHECAYCLGQMKNVLAIPYLITAIKDESEHPMVRHEAGEALGAIGNPTDEILKLLQVYSKHHVKELSETCELALQRLDYYQQMRMEKKSVESDTVYQVVDPTPAYSSAMSVGELKNVLLNEKRSLFDRYRALFALRNINTEASINAIGEGFFGSPEDSALFKHEVAFVLGQIQSEYSVDVLAKKLADLEENEIVRHECAEALGSIGRSDIIKNYLKDKSRIVRESCEVALEMAFEDDGFDPAVEIPVS